MTIRNIATLKTSSDFTAYLQSLGLSLSFDESVQSGPRAPLSQPYQLGNRTIGNRFAILPMEGWDGTTDGHPSDLTRRRWQRFGRSGAKLIFGGEAAAVRADGRANPNQLMIVEETLPELDALRRLLVQTHEERFAKSDDLLVGLQLTHSGRFSQPNDKGCLEPRILYHHPILDRKFGLPDDYPVMTDDEIARLVGDFIQAAVLAQQAGFSFVDIKHCHGYLGHEFLSALDRPGHYGGTLENRTRFLREIVSGIRARAPGLDIAVRLSAFDFLPFQSGKDGRGEPSKFNDDRYHYAFGGDGSGLGIDLTEPLAFLDLLLELDIRLVCITAGSGYYNPHFMRPAIVPPHGGYLPPEDPLMAVARLLRVTAELKRQRPDLAYITSGLTYLKQWLPNVAQHLVRTSTADFIGIGRMSLSYPEIVDDVLSGRPLKRQLICLTCSDCTTAPRNGMVSGCFARDDFYRSRPECLQLRKLKRQ